MSEPIVGYTNSNGLVQVERVFYYPAREGKKSFIKVPVAHREFYGGRNGSATYQTRYATLLAWGEVADAMQVLTPGDVVAFDNGKPNASLPYQNAKGEYSSVPEHKVQSWYRVSAAAPAPAAGPSPEARETETKAAFAAAAAAHDAAGKTTPAADFEADEFSDPFADQ